MASEYFIGTDQAGTTAITAEDGAYDYPDESGIPLDVHVSALDVVYTVWECAQGQQGHLPGVQYLPCVHPTTSHPGITA